VVGLGYAESKWVAESILRRASETTPLRPVSVRVGQLSGGVNGNWNASDWVPSIVCSAVSIGCLPDGAGVSIYVNVSVVYSDISQGTVSWIRADEAAAALLEMVSYAVED
jgi:thioester reductase-like protein